MNKKFNIPASIKKITLHLIVLEKISLSLFTKPTAAAATAIDWGDIILAIAPPIILDATSSEGSTPIWVAVTCCNPANSDPLFTTEPVKNTPIQPRIGETNGNIFPVLARANPNVEDIRISIC